MTGGIARFVITTVLMVIASQILSHFLGNKQGIAVFFAVWLMIFAAVICFEVLK